MYLIGSLLLAYVFTLFALSKIAAMLHAKKPGMGYIFLALIAGSIASFVVSFALGFLFNAIDPTVMIIVSLLCIFLVSTLAFKLINEMSWSGAITTNIASVALVLMTMTIALVLNGKSLDKIITAGQSTFEDNASMAQNIDSNEIGTVNESYKLEKDESIAEEDFDPEFKEIDLLPKATVKALEAKKNKVYRKRKYQVISISNIRSAVGKNIRIESKSGKKIQGALKNVHSSEAIIEQRISGGVAVMPISFAKIKKLEVYR